MATLHLHIGARYLTVLMVQNCMAYTIGSQQLLPRLASFWRPCLIGLGGSGCMLAVQKTLNVYEGSQVVAAGCGPVLGIPDPIPGMTGELWDL